MVDGSYANAKVEVMPTQHFYKYVNMLLCFSCRARSWYPCPRYTPLKKCS